MNTIPPRNRNNHATKNLLAARIPILVERFWLRPLFVLLCMMGPLAADQSGDFTYTNNGSFATITGYTGSGGAVVIPGTIVGLSVTAIGNSSFQSKSSITAVTIPSTVTSIGAYAFSYCSGLTSITIPAGVTSIGDAILTGCTNLITISVDAASLSYSSAGGVLFNKTQTTLIQYPGGKTGGYAIPSGVTHIGSAAFQSNAGLTSVTIPASVTNIGTYAFYFTGLGNVTIPAAVTTIGTDAFAASRFMSAISVDSANSAYSSANGALFNKTQTTLLQCPGGKTGAYTIPSTVTTIAYHSFYYCQYLTGVTIPTSVTSINSYAFDGCSGLTSISIPSSVTSIGSAVFSSCSSLTDISVAASNPSYSSFSGVLFNKTQTTLIQCPAGKSGLYAIPSGVTTISGDSFFYCSQLTGVTIPSSVTSIGSQAFFACYGLTSVTIPSSVTTIRSRAFVYCYALTEAIFAGNAPAIMEYGVFDSAASGFTVKFYTGATGFTTPTWQGYPSQMLTGGGGATLADAVDAPSLAFATGGSATWLSQSSVTHDGIDAAASGDIGNNQESWMQTTVTGPGTITFWWAVASDANDVLQFYINGVLQTGAISGNVPWQQKTFGLGVGTNILRWRYSKDPFGDMFADTAWVDEVVWTPGGGSNPADFTYTTSGGSATVTGYTGLGGAVTIPGTLGGLPVVAIGDSAFQFKFDLTGVTLPASVTVIGNSAFSNCYNLDSVTLGSSVTTIGSYAFSGVGASTIVLPASVTSIGTEAFYASDLTTMMIPAALTSIGTQAFKYCRAMQSFSVDSGNPNYSSSGGVLFNKNQTTLIQYPLAKSGSSYGVPSGVVTIGDSAFASVGYQATGISLPASVLNIQDEAFYSCLGLLTITVDIGNPNFSSLGGVLFNKNQTTLLVYPGGKVGTYSIPAGVTAIAKNAFAYCWELTGVTIPEGVVSIGETAFYYSYKITSLTFPASVTSIGSAAFNFCSGLLAVDVAVGNGSYSSYQGVLFNQAGNILLYFPGGRTGTYEIRRGTQQIAESAFSSCKLSGVVFPSSITSIGAYAFGGSNQLASGTFLGNAPTVVSGAFAYAASGFSIYFYQGATGFTVPTWQGYPATMLPGFVTWANAAGLTGNNALPGAIPFGDGVPNLLKFAFGLNPSGPDARQMVPGGAVGLPTSYMHINGGTVWRVEYLRRKNSGLTYTPKKSTTLGGGSFAPLTGTPMVSEIVGFPDWQRVIVDEPYNPVTTPQMFTTVEIVGQ